MNTGRWPAPAKLNLFLHIVGRRSDGYHELQTVFQLVDLCDQLQITPTDDGVISRAPPPTHAVLASLAADADLSVRAARLLQQASASRGGARLYIEKRIPSGGGLGGGSSDAAAVLLALNELWELHWPRERLAALGLQLGADVPLFVLGNSAWGEGRGERLTPIDLPPRWFLILHPGVSVSTAAIFQAPELTRNSALLAMPREFDEDFWARTRNDCEPIVRRGHPEVTRALDWLGRFAPARLTGTGSCVFAAFDSHEQAAAVAKSLPGGWTGFVVRGLQRSPR